MQNSNMKLAYAMKDESGVIERVVKNANSNTSSVYSFVENNDSKKNTGWRSRVVCPQCLRE